MHIGPAPSDPAPATIFTVLTLPAVLSLLDVPFLRLSRNAELLETSDAARRLLDPDLEAACKQLACVVQASIDDWRRQPSHPRSRAASVTLPDRELDLRLSILCPAPARPEALAVFVPAPGRARAGARSQGTADGLATLLQECRMSRREQDVARHLLAGRSTPTIAQQLGISLHTVRRHKEQVYRKLGVRSHAALVRRLLAEGTA